MKKKKIKKNTVFSKNALNKIKLLKEINVIKVKNKIVVRFIK